MERAGRVGWADVEVDAVRGAAVAGFAPRRLEHLAGDLVDRRIAVRAKRRVHPAGAGRHFVARGVDVVEAVEALVPLGPTVGTRTHDVVVLEVDQGCRAASRFVRGLIGRAGSRVIDRQPLPVRARYPGATTGEHVLVYRRAAISCGRHAQAGERIEVREVLLAAAVEVDVGVPAAGRVGQAGERAGRRPGRNHPEGLALVDRSEPGAPLRPGAGRPADEDAALRIDTDIWLAVGVDRID